MPTTALAQAQEAMSGRVLDRARLVPLLGSSTARAKGDVPFSLDELSRAGAAGSILLWRSDRFSDGTPITVEKLHERFAESATPGRRGFRPNASWYLREAFAQNETPEPGWALVLANPAPASCNQLYGAGWRALAPSYGASGWRRRRAVEIAYDALASASCGGEPLLAAAWDWSSSASADGGWINIGGFTDAGLEVLSYSDAVKHGQLGICPTLVRS